MFSRSHYPSTVYCLRELNPPRLHCLFLSLSLSLIIGGRNRIRGFKKCMEELEKYILSMDKSYNFLFLLSLMLGEVGHHVCYIEYIYIINDLRERLSNRNISIGYLPRTVLIRLIMSKTQLF